MIILQKSLCRRYSALAILSLSLSFICFSPQVSAKYVSGKNAALLSANRLSVDRKYNQAVELYKEAILAEPKNFNCYHLYGRTLALMGLTSEAIEQYKMAAALNPNNSELYNDLGVAYVLNEDISQGALCLKRSVELNSRYAAVYNNLGVALQKLGDYKQAYDAFACSLKIQPANPVIQKRLLAAKGKLSLSQHFELAKQNEALPAESNSVSTSSISESSTEIVKEPASPEEAVTKSDSGSKSDLVETEARLP